jgi:TDG/mug DNA glycosylase family protein
MPNRRPTPEELHAAVGRTVPDLIRPGLTVLFCGINPGLYSAAVGHHFARPGNRFWPAIHQAAFTDEQLSPFAERELLDFGYGITNLVNRATAAADELSPQELRTGGRRVVAKVQKYHPRFLAVIGITAYRGAFDRPHAQPGRQPETIGPTALWLLPNPSGLNAHYQLADLVSQFQALHDAAEQARVGRRA